MDFQINNHQQFNSGLREFLDDLKERGYSESTLKGYRSFLKKTWSYITQMDKDSTYTQESSQRFISDILPELQLSNSSTKHIQTAIRRFNDYLSQQPYVFRQGSGKEETPEIFQKVLDDYIECMNRRGLKPATIEVRRIFAAQFLNSVYNQGIHSINEIYGSHVGVTVLSTGSVEGVCQKLPYFLKYLKDAGLTEIDLSKSIPSFITEKKLPSIYNKNELIQVLTSIDRSSPSGKRDYAIMLILVTYGLRAKDLVELKIENIDFQHGQLTFRQSKTGNIYRVELLHEVQEALDAYLSEVNPASGKAIVFHSLNAPFRPLSRSAVWSIVAAKLKSSIETNNRKRGSHAIRSSMASGLIADDVPYAVVQKVLGHTDPNATKRYVAIDIERLRKCSLDCPVETGRFLSYLEGGAWK